MYNVVFVGTREAKGREGVVTVQSWRTKRDFEWDYASWPEGEKAKKRIVEQGIPLELCAELVSRTPVACLVAAAIEKATRQDGVIDREVLHKELEIIQFTDPGNLLLGISKDVSRVPVEGRDGNTSAEGFNGE